ncbi:hypothetical protein [Pedobacter sp. SL55]
MFELTQEEYGSLRSQIVILKKEVDIFILGDRLRQINLSANLILFC